MTDSAGADVPVITIDGPSGSGKGTVSQLLARTLGWNFLDSGALYRLLALSVQWQNVDPDDLATLVRIAAAMQVSFAPTEQLEAQVLLDGRDASRAIRDEALGEMASRVAALAPVREALLDRQRRFATLPGLVADGRDMGTVVFPAAALKVFLTASAEERALRRSKQLKDKGENVNFAQILQAIAERDERDRNRPVSPLKPAGDAVLIDSTGLSIDEVQERILVEGRSHGLLQFQVPTK